MSRHPRFTPPESINMQDVRDALLARFGVSPEEYDRAFRYSTSRTHGPKSLNAVHVALDLAQSFGVESALALSDKDPVSNVAQSDIDSRDESTEVVPVHMTVEGYAACKTAALDDVLTRTLRNVTCQDCEARFLKATPVHWWKGAREAVCGFTSGKGTTDVDHATCPSCIVQDNKWFLDARNKMIADKQQTA